MALKRFKIDGYGQIELNNVAFRRDGRIEAQCKLKETTYEEDGTVKEQNFDKVVPAENGMLLAVDKANGVVKFPAEGEVLPIAVHYSTEHMYDERANSLKDFALVPGTFLPRMGYLAVGDLFTTNCLCYDDGEFATEEDIFTYAKTNDIWVVPSAIGAGKITKTAGDGTTLKVVKKYTMPNGTPGVKLQVVKA